MRIIRRYVLAQFIGSFGVSAAAFVVIFIVIDLSNRISAYLDRGASAVEIAAYYVWSVPYFMFLALPMAMLLGSLFCLGGLARRNELSAMKASGISLYRILLPIQLFAMVTSLGVWEASSALVPRANRERAARTFSSPSPARQHRVQLVVRDEGGQVVTMGEYRVDQKRAKRVMVDRYADGVLMSKVRASELVWVGDGWVFVDGERRLFDSKGEHVAAFDSVRADAMTLLPDDFSRQSRPIEQIDTPALRKLVERKRMNGLEASRDRVELDLRMAFSFSGLVMVLFGLPLSSHTRHASRPLQVGICLLVSFVFYGSLQATRAMGWNGLLDPTVAAWGPNVIFLAIGSLMLSRAHT